jgi:uncharacterized protein
MSDTALVIMARYPEKGKTKTRLARSIGDEATLSLYQAFLTDLAQHFAGWKYDLYWAYTPNDIDFSLFAATLAPLHAATMRSFPQHGPDLGTCLHQVFLFLQAQQYRNIIVIGSDSPHIRPSTILEAQQALAKADIVLGPAEDGGYYLIAMREPYDVFSGIPMSTNVVLQLTIEKAQRQGLSVHLLESLFDIDELPELLRLAQLLRAENTRAPATAIYLAHLENQLL